MPTGYTANLYDDEQTFEDFALGCARAFGALVFMRDDPSDAEIPEEFTAPSYHLEAVERARQRMEELAAMTDEECEQAALKDFDAKVTADTKSRSERTARFLRYEAMVEMVNAWHPPTSDHQELKSFMLDQLKQSIDFDTRGFDQFEAEPKKLTGFQWRDEEAKRAGSDLVYRLAEHEKETQRATERTAWVRALRESLQGVTA